MDLDRTFLDRTFPDRTFPGQPDPDHPQLTGADLAGVFVPLVTPFDDAGELALAALEGLAHQVLDDGAAGVVALGTTAEPGSLTDRERTAVVEVAARVCRERGAVLIVGAGSVEAVRDLGTRPGVGAALSVVPPFVRPGQAGVEAYFRALAAASPVPLVVYHVPERTGQDLAPETLRRLAELPNVIGVKYATGRIDADTVALLDDLPDGFAVLGGDDVILAPLLALGARGAILASAHLATAQFVELVDAWRAIDAWRAADPGGADDARWVVDAGGAEDAWRAEDARRVRALGRRLAALSATVFAEPNPTVLKAVLHARGRIPTPAVRLPLLPAGPRSVRAAIDQLAEVPGARLDGRRGGRSAGRRAGAH
jgi:4-hydroxy-tetrahydrodipicolinate synthase